MSGHTSGKRILVVDDEAQIQRFLTPALIASRLRGLERQLNGTDALKKAATEAPDAVVLDLGLPDMDGKDVIRQLRAWSDVPLIVLSARDRESEKIAALDLGADDYVEKPFGIGEFMARLRTALRRKARVEGEETRVEIGTLVVDTLKRPRHQGRRGGAPDAEGIRTAGAAHPLCGARPSRIGSFSPASGARRMWRIRNICASSSASFERRSSRIRRSRAS